MERLDELKQKYASVLQLIAKGGVRLDHLHVQDNKLFLQGAAASQDLKNKVWSQIKAVDAAFPDITVDLSIDSSLPEPPPDPVIYTVVAGDSLWRIAEKFYGNGSKYPKIIAGNPGKLKDEKSVIHPGDELVIPPAE